jgi:hypothetical protein
LKAKVHPARDGMTKRQKLILSGLYLSKYDSLGVKKLGFDSFVEAFNVIGYALGSRPASIKNYRDEFDPLFQTNRRKGWHKRPTRDYCRAVFEEYKSLDFDSFTGLVRSFFGFDENLLSEIVPMDQQGDGATSFAQRLITGVAAEQYFEAVHAGLPEFKDHLIDNTTRFGCGYDFRLRSEAVHEDFLAVEVKGLKGQTGSLSLTPKEYDVASALRDRFFLFVVRNFRESPSHVIFQDPLSSGLQFRRAERVTVQVSWLTTI